MISRLATGIANSHSGAEKGSTASASVACPACEQAGHFFCTGSPPCRRCLDFPCAPNENTATMNPNATDTKEATQQESTAPDSSQMQHSASAPIRPLHLNAGVQRAMMEQQPAIHRADSYPHASTSERSHSLSSILYNRSQSSTGLSRSTSSAYSEEEGDALPSGNGSQYDWLGDFKGDATVKPKPKPVVRACVHCKRAHLACDNHRPCKRCVHLGKEGTCVDVEHKKRGRPKAQKSADGKKGASTESTTGNQPTQPQAATPDPLRQNVAASMLATLHQSPSVGSAQNVVSSNPQEMTPSSRPWTELECLTVHALDGTFISATADAEALFGYRPEELQKRILYEFIPPEDWPALVQLQEHLMNRSNAELIRINIRFRHKTGRLVMLDFTMTLLRNAFNRSDALVCCSRPSTRGMFNPAEGNPPSMSFPQVNGGAPMVPINPPSISGFPSVPPMPHSMPAPHQGGGPMHAPGMSNMMPNRPMQGMEGEQLLTTTMNPPYSMYPNSGQQGNMMSQSTFPSAMNANEPNLMANRAQPPRAGIDVGANQGMNYMQNSIFRSPAVGSGPMPPNVPSAHGPGLPPPQFHPAGGYASSNINNLLYSLSNMQGQGSTQQGYNEQHPPSNLVNTSSWSGASSMQMMQGRFPHEANANPSRMVPVGRNADTTTSASDLPG